MSTHKYSAFRPSPPPSLPFIHHRTRQDLYHCRSTNKLIDTVIPFNETSLRTSSLANSVVIISDSKSFTTNPAYGASASSNSISTPSSNTIPGPAAFDSAAKPPEFTNDELKHLSAFVASLAVDPKVDLSRAASLLTLTEGAARYALNNVLKRFDPDLSVYDIPAPRPRPRAPYATRSNKRTRSENDKAAENDSPPIPAKRARGRPHTASSSTAASKTAPARRRSSSKGSTIRVKRLGKDN